MLLCEAIVVVQVEFDEYLQCDSSCLILSRKVPKSQKTRRGIRRRRRKMFALNSLETHSRPCYAKTIERLKFYEVLGSNLRKYLNAECSLVTILKNDVQGKKRDRFSFWWWDVLCIVCGATNERTRLDWVCDEISFKTVWCRCRCLLRELRSKQNCLHISKRIDSSQNKEILHQPLHTCTTMLNHFFL